MSKGQYDSDLSMWIDVVNKTLLLLEGNKPLV
jgi:hypothetical protein